jgi:hypothetical protein
MSDDPIDLSALRSPRDQVTEDRVVRAVMQQIGRDLSPEPDLVAAVGGLARPTLIAAGLIIAIGGSIVLRERSVRPAVPATTWESLGLPVTVERWAATGVLDPRAVLDELGSRR